MPDIGTNADWLRPGRLRNKLIDNLNSVIPIYGLVWGNCGFTSAVARPTFIVGMTLPIGI
jgi:hypothetical protein